MSDGARLPGVARLAMFGLLAAAVASAAPLTAYVGSLALFGLPHVLAELRYVDRRFGRRIGGGTLVAVAGIVLMGVGARVLGMSGLAQPLDAYALEIGLVAVLALVAVPTLVASPWRAAVALGLGAALTWGSATAPITTLVLLAVLHNVTPVGFLLERFRGGVERRTVLVGGAVLFVLVPIVVASGLPAAVLDAPDLDARSAAFGSAGALERHVKVFVPEGWFAAEREAHVFAAVTYLQLLHYGAVLLVLPRLVAKTDRSSGLVPWPTARVFALVVAAFGLVTAVGFAHDFVGTRATYALVAALHAWIEIPILLLALAPPRTSPAVSAPAT